MNVKVCINNVSADKLQRSSSLNKLQALTKRSTSQVACKNWSTDPDFSRHGFSFSKHVRASRHVFSLWAYRLIPSHFEPWYLAYVSSGLNPSPRRAEEKIAPGMHQFRPIYRVTVTSHNLWSRYDRHFVGIYAIMCGVIGARIYPFIQIELNQFGLRKCPYDH